MKKILTILSLLLAVPCALMAQEDIVGKWKTIDDETGDPKSVVEFYKKDGKVFGKIIKLYRDPDQDPDPICKECPKDDPRYRKKVIGMEIIKDLARDGDEYAGGTVLKPDEGKIYKCKIWREGEKLKVRGYWGFLYRTQTWLKVN